MFPSKKYLFGAVFVVAFILYVDHFYKNTESNTAESAHPVVKKDSEQPKQEQKEVEVDITTIIKKISVPLPEGIFATLRGRSLYLSPDAQITEPRAVMAFVAYEIWYENAGNSRFDPSMKDMEQTLKDAKSDQNRAFHREEWVRKGISEEQYWQEFETQVEKELRTWKYLHHMIGEPSEVGGAEFKKAMNDFIVKTFINHQTVIQINENMISF